jgi:hypothetical protein
VLGHPVRRDENLVPSAHHALLIAIINHLYR